MQYPGLLFAMFVALAAALATGQVLAKCGFPIPAVGKRIGCVDGLRGYLALMVMMHHFDLWTNKTRFGTIWGASSSTLLHNFGPGGVALFFMATGLVFYPRIERGFRAVDWRATYVSRVFRILPLQVVMVAVAAGISLAMAPAGAIGSLTTNLIALANWLTSYREPPLFGYGNSGAINAYVLWSLWYEWMFYLFVLPLLAVLQDRVRGRVPAWAIPLAAIVVGTVLGPFLQHPLTAVVFFLPLFAFGMLGFQANRSPRVRTLLSGAAAGALAAVALAVAMIWGGIAFVLPQLLAYALFFCCIASGNSFAGLFALKGSIVLGEVSFGIYLIHGTVLYLLFTFALPADLSMPALYATLPLAAVVAVLVSAVAHLAIERPAIALGRRVGNRLSHRPPRPFSPAIDRESANLAP